MTRPRWLSSLLGLILILQGACAQAPQTPPETLTMAGRPVTLSPPPATWLRTHQTIPPAQELEVVEGPQGAPGAPETRVRQLEGGDLYRFIPPWSEGYLTLSAIGNWTEPTLSEAHIRHLQNAVLKRSGGQVDSQEEARLGEASGYQMAFRYEDRGVKTRGLQIHAIHQQTYYSVVLSVPEARWREAEPCYRQLVESWRFQSAEP